MLSIPKAATLTLDTVPAHIWDLLPNGTSGGNGLSTHGVFAALFSLHIAAHPLPPSKRSPFDLAVASPWISIFPPESVLEETFPAYWPTALLGVPR